MSNRRTVALALAAWLVVVAAGAGLVWTVISRVGEGVASTAQPTLDATSTSTPTTRRTPSNGAREPDARRTWHGAPGYVTAECVGNQISVTNAQPVVGYRFELDDAGPDEIRVEFEAEAEAETEGVRVSAHCQDGIPVFDVGD